MAADVQNDALSVDFRHQALTGPGEADLRVEAAATKFIGDVVSDAANTEAELAIGTQILDLGLSADDQSSRDWQTILIAQAARNIQIPPPRPQS
jgi:hypothetical protein